MSTLMQPASVSTVGRAPIVAPANDASGVLSPAQLAARRNGVGASDVAAILGVSKYRGPFDVWLAKRGLVEDGPMTGPQEWGHLLEPVVADRYVAGQQEALGVPLWARPAGTAQHPTHRWALATPDRVIETATSDEWLLEVKTASAYLASDWGTPGTDEIPVYYATQCHWQLLVTGMDRCDVAVLIGGQDYRTYTVRADAQLHRDLLDRVGTWWARHIVEGVEPPVEGASAEGWLAQKYPKVGRDLVLDADATAEELLAQLAETKATLAALEASEADLKARIKAVIGDARAIKGTAGRASWFDVKGRTSVDWEAVVKEADVKPSIIRAHTTIGPGTRQFKFTPAKEA